MEEPKDHGWLFVFTLTGGIFILIAIGIVATILSR